MARGFNLEVWFFFFSTNLSLFPVLPSAFDRGVAARLAAAALDTYLPAVLLCRLLVSQLSWQTSRPGNASDLGSGKEKRPWKGRWAKTLVQIRRRQTVLWKSVTLLSAEWILYHCTGLLQVNANQSLKSTVSSFLTTLWRFFLLSGILEENSFRV